MAIIIIQIVKYCLVKYVAEKTLFSEFGASRLEIIFFLKSQVAEVDHF